jgi:hypothetical protein
VDHPIKAPERTTAEVFPQYIGGEIVADSAKLKWSGLFARRYQFARVVDGFLVPATAEPLIACNIAGSAEVEEREIGGRWRSYRVRSGDLFVTCSKTLHGLHTEASRSRGPGPALEPGSGKSAQKGDELPFTATQHRFAVTK